MSPGPNDKRREWTAEEQRILEEGLAKYPPQQDINMEVRRYVKIALLLDQKTVLDVADRVHLFRDWTAEEQRILEEGLAQHPPQQDPAMEDVRYAKIAEMLEYKTVEQVAARVHLGRVWSAEEQRILEEGLAEHPPQQEPEMAVLRYAKIAEMLENKTVEQVAARVQEMKIKSQPKPRGRKRKEKEPERLAVRPLLYQDLTRRIQAGDEDANDSELEKLLKRNAKNMDQIKSNLESSDGMMNNANLFKESLQSLHEMVRLVNEDTELPGGFKFPKF